MISTEEIPRTSFSISVSNDTIKDDKAVYPSDVNGFLGFTNGTANVGANFYNHTRATYYGISMNIIRGYIDVR